MTDLLLSIASILNSIGLLCLGYALHLRHRSDHQPKTTIRIEHRDLRRAIHEGINEANRHAPRDMRS